MKIEPRFRKVHALKRREHHPLLHKIHRKHKISYQTLFYMKEYNTRAHTITTVLSQSLKIIVAMAIVSAFGGIGLETIKEKFVLIMPLMIMLPALNDMVGDFGATVSSKFATMLYTRQVRLSRGVLRSGAFMKLVRNMLIVSVLSSVYVGILSSAVALYSGFPLDGSVAIRVVILSVATTSILIGMTFLSAVLTGVYIFSRKEDPNNFLIPITTAVADLGSMIVFSLLVLYLF